MTTDEQAIREFFPAWLQASLDSDKDTLRGMLAEDVIFLTVERPPMIGRDAFFAASGSAPKPSEMKFVQDIKEVHVNGDWAQTWAHLTVTIVPSDGAPAVRRAGNILTLFRKENGKWVIWRDANLLTIQREMEGR